MAERKWRKSLENGSWVRVERAGQLHVGEVTLVSRMYREDELWIRFDDPRVRDNFYKRSDRRISPLGGWESLYKPNSAAQPQRPKSQNPPQSQPRAPLQGVGGFGLPHQRKGPMSSSDAKVPPKTDRKSDPKRSAGSTPASAAAASSTLDAYRTVLLEVMKVKRDALTFDDQDTLVSSWARCISLRTELESKLVEGKVLGEFETRVRNARAAHERARDAATTSIAGNELRKRAADALEYVEGTIAEQRSEKKRQDDIAKESQRMTEQLGNDFVMVQIPGDGNCMYAAIARGRKILLDLKRAPRSVDARSRLLQNQIHMTDQRSAEIAGIARQEVIQELKKAKYQKEIKEEVKFALRDRLQQTQSFNVTELKMRNVARQKMNLFQLQSKAQFSDDERIRIYTDVHATPGIFGERLQLRALAAHFGLRVRVHIVSGAGGGSETEEVGDRGMTVDVAFYMTGNHYNLLVPRSLLRGVNVSSPAMDKKKKSPATTTATATTTPATVRTFPKGNITVYLKLDGRQGKEILTVSDTETIEAILTRECKSKFNINLRFGQYSVQHRPSNTDPIRTLYSYEFLRTPRLLGIRGGTFIVRQLHGGVSQDATLQDSSLSIQSPSRSISYGSASNVGQNALRKELWRVDSGGSGIERGQSGASTSKPGDDSYWEKLYSPRY